MQWSCGNDAHKCITRYVHASVSDAIPPTAPKHAAGLGFHDLFLRELNHTSNVQGVKDALKIDMELI